MIQIKTASQTTFLETAIGLIPSDWDLVPLQELGLTFHGGATPSRKNDEYWNGDIPWVTSAYLDDRLYLETCADYITLEGLHNSSTRVVPKGNLLIGTRVGVGKVAINLQDTAISQDLTAMIVDLSKVDAKFLAYVIRSDTSQRQILASARGTTIKGIPRSDLLAVQLPIPPHVEQVRIAGILSIIQDEIDSLYDVIRELKEFKRSVMKQLFTFGMADTLSDRKVMDIGEFPAHWDAYPLHDLAEIKYGYQTSIPKTPPNQGLDIISTAEIRNEGYLDLSNIRKVNVELGDVEQYLVRKNDILFNWRNSQEHVGKTALVETDLPEPTIYASFIVRIRPQRLVSHKYIHYLLSYLRDCGLFFTLSRRAVNQANFNANQLGTLIVPVPSELEQEKITGILQDLDEKLAAEEDRMTALEDLFRTMLHQLMTGQIRLFSDEVLPYESN